MLPVLFSVRVKGLFAEQAPIQVQSKSEEGVCVCVQEIKTIINKEVEQYQIFHIFLNESLHKTTDSKPNMIVSLTEFMFQ